MNLPTVLVIATAPETDFGSRGDPLLHRIGDETLLESHIRTLAGLGCRWFVVVGSDDAKPVVEQLRDALGFQLRFVPEPRRPSTLAGAFVAAEPALSHFATGPVLATQPHYVVDGSLYSALLRAWTDRSSGVEGIVATSEVGEPASDDLLLLADGERLTGCIAASAASDADADAARQYVGALACSWSRELCETIGEEAEKGDREDAVARGLNRLIAWSEFRNLAYSGPRLRLRTAEDLQQLQDGTWRATTPQNPALREHAKKPAAPRAPDQRPATQDRIQRPNSWR